MNPLYVDRRIGSGELAKRLTKAGMRVKVVTLEFADFWFEGNGPTGPIRIGIERKKVDELVGAITDSQRIKRQFKGMLRAYAKSWVVVEGDYRQGRQGELRIGHREAGHTRQRWLWETFEHFLTSIAIQGPHLVGGPGGRLLLKHTYDDYETVAWIASTYRWWQKRWADHSTFKTVDEVDITETGLDKRDPDYEYKRQVFAQLPGVYYVRSRAAADTFRSILHGAVASEKRWRAVPGIGPKTASKIVRQIRKRCQR